MSAHACESQPGCITCGDIAIPMRVLEVRDATAVCVDEEGTRHEVAADLIESVQGERWLLVHAGVAIAAVEAPADAIASGGRR